MAALLNDEIGTKGSSCDSENHARLANVRQQLRRARTLVVIVGTREAAKASRDELVKFANASNVPHSVHGENSGKQRLFSDAYGASGLSQNDVGR